MLAGGTVKNTGVGSLYLAFDAAVAAILAAQGWSLARLVRRDDRLEVPLRGSSCALAQGRRWALPLLWEFGVPAAIAVLPAKFKVNWKAMFLYGPDVSYALTAIGGLAALTGILRIAKAARAPCGQTRSL